MPASAAIGPAEVAPKTSLLDLSEELLVEIGAFLAGATMIQARHELVIEAQDDLTSLALTNRRLNRIATPYLYVNCGNFKADAAKLLKSLIRRPPLAELVQVLHWRYAQPHPTNLVLQPGLWEADYRRCLDMELSRLGLESERKFEGASNPNTSSDYLAAAMLVTPNVKTLKIADLTDSRKQLWYDSHEVPCWVSLLATAGRSPSSHFRNLRSIKIKLGALKLGQISGLLLIQSLRSLTLIEIYEPFAEELEPWACPDRESLIEDLSVERSFISSVVVAQLLRSIKSLMNFSFYYNPDSRTIRELDPTSFSGMINFPTMKIGLLHHTNTLQRLAIISSLDFSRTTLETSGSWDILGSLQDFRKLCSIEIGITAFINVSASLDGSNQVRALNLLRDLPPNIELLKVVVKTENHVIWERALQDLAAYCSALPALRSICSLYVCPKSQAFPTIKRQLASVTQRFANRGIELHVFIQKNR